MTCEKCNAEMVCVLSWVQTDETHMRRKISLKCIGCFYEFEWQRIGDIK